MPLPEELKRFISPPGPDEFLYKYVSLETALCRILPKLRLRLSRLSAMNDPRESRSWYPQFISDSGVDLGNITELQEKADYFLKQKCRILCFTKDLSVESNLIRGFAHPRMWAQYANDHKGACLVLRRLKIAKLIEEQFGSSWKIDQDSVSYRDDKGTGLISTIDLGDALRENHEGAIKKFAEENLKDLYFVKAEDWRDEAEYRWLFSGGTDADAYLNIEGAVFAVILGINAAEDEVERTIEICEAAGALPLKMVWLRGKPYFLILNSKQSPA